MSREEDRRLSYLSLAVAHNSGKSVGRTGNCHEEMVTSLAECNVGLSGRLRKGRSHFHTIANGDIATVAELSHKLLTLLVGGPGRTRTFVERAPSKATAISAHLCFTPVVKQTALRLFRYQFNSQKRMGYRPADELIRGYIKTALFFDNGQKLIEWVLGLVDDSKVLI
jgi:hypothetical protein